MVEVVQDCRNQRAPKHFFMKVFFRSLTLLIWRQKTVLTLCPKYFHEWPNVIFTNMEALERLKLLMPCVYCPWTLLTRKSTFFCGVGSYLSPLLLVSISWSDWCNFSCPMFDKGNYFHLPFRVSFDLDKDLWRNGRDTPQNCIFWKYIVGGAPITPWGWMGVDFLDHELL